MATESAEYIGVSDLAAAVGEALSQSAEVDRRMKSGATEIPSERTIRFYLEKGLLPKPTKRLGQTLVFGQIHLLHLLVIKKLQADGVPLSAIPDVLKKKGKTEAQLEGLLGEEVEVVRSRVDLESFGQRTVDFDDIEASFSLAQSARPMQQLSDEPPTPPTSMEAPPSQAKSYLRSLLSRSPKSEPPQPVPAKPEAPPRTILRSRPPAATPARWTRHEPAPGVEINISDDYDPPKDEHGKLKLLESIRKILGI